MRCSTAATHLLSELLFWKTDRTVTDGRRTDGGGTTDGRSTDGRSADGSKPTISEAIDFEVCVDFRMHDAFRLLRSTHVDDPRDQVLANFMISGRRKLHLRILPVGT